MKKNVIYLTKYNDTQNGMLTVFSEICPISGLYKEFLLEPNGYFYGFAVEIEKKGRQPFCKYYDIMTGKHIKNIVKYINKNL